MNKLNCDSCEREIKPGEFMAILTKYPTKSHMGRTDAIIKKWVNTTDGTIYCKKCFENQ